MTAEAEPSTDVSWTLGLSWDARGLPDLIIVRCSCGYAVGWPPGGAVHAEELDQFAHVNHPHDPELWR